MFGKSDLVDDLSRDLSSARNKTRCPIVVLEASLLTKKDRRERERAVSDNEKIKKRVNDQYLAFVPTIAGFRGATEMVAASVEIKETKIRREGFVLLG